MGSKKEKQKSRDEGKGEERKETFPFPPTFFFCSFSCPMPICTSHTLRKEMTAMQTATY